MESALIRIHEVIAFASVFLLLFIQAIAFSKFRKLPREMRFLNYYLLTILVVEIIAKYQAYVLKQDNIYLLPYYTFLEFLWLMLFFRESLKFGKKAKRQFGIFFFVTIIPLGIYTTYSTLFDHRLLIPANFQLYQKIITHFVFVFFCMIYFYQLVVDGQTLSIMRKKNPLFPVFSGMLIYYSGSFVVFMALNYAINLPLSQSIMLWLLNSCLTLLLYSMILFSHVKLLRTWKPV
jgi:hypothetical protein